MESAKLAPQPFHPVLSEVYLHPMCVVMGRDLLIKAGGWGRQDPWAGAGAGVTQSCILSHWPVLALRQGWLSHAERAACNGDQNEWPSCIIHELERTFVPDKITYRISLQWTTARLQHTTSISLRSAWMGAAPALTLSWNNAQILLLEASGQFGLHTPINPYFFSFFFWGCQQSS